MQKLELEHLQFEHYTGSEAHDLTAFYSGSAGPGFLSVTISLFGCNVAHSFSCACT